MPQKRSAWTFWFVISLLFFGAQLLLPVERGLTITSLFGAPVYLPMIVNFVGVVLIFLFHPARIFSKASKPWVIANFVFAVLCLCTSLISTSWQTSLFYSYMWVSNFVLCFLIVDLLVEKIKLKGLVLAISAVAVCQIAVGIMEGFFQTRLLIYQLASLNYMNSMGAIVLADRGNSWDLRILGTLGDPILFGTALMLSIPFLARLNHRFIRLSLICAASVVALMTLSRTVFVFLGCYLAVYLWNCSLSRKVAAALAVLAIFLVLTHVDNPLSDNWSMRLDDEAAAQNGGGVELRKEMTTEVIADSLWRSNLWQALCGHGFYSTANIASQYQDVSTTIDNAYATILYENGLIGLILYLVICWLPFRSISRASPRDYLLIAGYGAILLCGFSFVSSMVFSVNILLMTIVVSMDAEALKAQDRPVHGQSTAWRQARRLGCSPRDAFALGSQ